MKKKSLILLRYDYNNAIIPPEKDRYSSHYDPNRKRGVLV